MMTDMHNGGDEWVMLWLNRNRGWPWPEDSYGLSPMYGDDGWCRSCGVPRGEQVGPMALQRKGTSAARGAFMPYWRYDSLCVDEHLAEAMIKDFGVSFRPVVWARGADSHIVQMVIPVVGTSWYDQSALRSEATRQFGGAGVACLECGTWRWMPLFATELELQSEDAVRYEGPIMASPEWFGAGHQSARHILIRRKLAEFVVEHSPRDFRIEQLAS